MWSTAPEELLCLILQWLSAQDIVACSKVCSRWRAICSRACVWREKLKNDFGVTAVSLAVLAKRTDEEPDAARAEYNRCSSPWQRAAQSTSIPHEAPLTFVTLSRDSLLACSTSQDGTFAIWNKNGDTWKVLWTHDTQPLGWWHPIAARFSPDSINQEEYKLLLCGALRVDTASPRGELAIYSISVDKEPCLLSRVSLSPLWARGAWWSDGRVLTAQMHWLSRRACATTLWLCSDSQETQSELTPVMSQLCKLFNDSGSVPRLMELCPLYERVESGDTMVELWDDIEEPEYYDRTTPELPESLDDIEELDKLLIFTCGVELSASHLLCFVYLPQEAAYWPTVVRSKISLEDRLRERRLRRQEEQEREEDSPEERERREQADVETVRENCVDPDRIIDLRGHIVGVAIAPDYSMLYAAAHIWRGPNAESIDARVSICAVCLREVRVIWRSRPSLTKEIGSLPRSYASSMLHYIQPAVSTYYVASPLGGCSLDVCLWSRVSGACLRTLRHSSPAHSVAISDAGTKHTLLCANDQHTIAVWESTPDFFEKTVDI